MANCDYLQTQLTSVLNSLVKIAVVELLRIVEDSAVELRLEVSKSKFENEALKNENESNKNKLQRLEAELWTAGNRPCSICNRCVGIPGRGKGGYVSPKRDQDAVGPPNSSEEDDASSWLQQSAHTMEETTAMERDGIQIVVIKNEAGHEGTQRKKDTQAGISTEGEQLCPKVDMVYGKEWSQNLWRDGDAVKEDSAGPSVTHRQWLTSGQSSSVDLRNLRRRRRVRTQPHPQRRGTYLRYTPEQRAKIARMCMEVGAQMAAAMMSEELGRRISPNTVRSMRISYEQTVESMGVQKVEDLPHLRPFRTDMFDEEITRFVMVKTVSAQKRWRVCVKKSVIEDEPADSSDAGIQHQNTTESRDVEKSFEPESYLNFEENRFLTSPVNIMVPKCVKLPGAAAVMDTQLDKSMDFDNMNNSGRKKRGRKTGPCKGNVNYCFVCGEPQSKISRHLKQHEKENAEIAYALSLDIASRQRKVLLEKLRNKGNFQHNTNVVNKGSGCLKVKRKPKPNSGAKRFEPCLYCKGMFIWQDVRRHMGRCPCRPEDGDKNQEHYGKKRFLQSCYTGRRKGKRVGFE
ncbi:unnamed protein product [Coregonus sp. 'balchen']|nr:unnamed protein product [Coregonus sp. 'balchen']